jgi:hypothetical protein
VTKINRGLSVATPLDMAIDKIGKKERRDNEIVRICWL